MKLRMGVVAFCVAALGVALIALPAAAGMKINIGSTYGPDAPVHFGQVKFKELVEQRSKGDSSRSRSTSAAPWAASGTSSRA